MFHSVQRLTRKVFYWKYRLPTCRTQLNTRSDRSTWSQKYCLPGIEPFGCPARYTCRSKVRCTLSPSRGWSVFFHEAGECDKSRTQLSQSQCLMLRPPSGSARANEKVWDVRLIEISRETRHCLALTFFSFTKLRTTLNTNTKYGFT